MKEVQNSLHFEFGKNFVTKSRHHSQESFLLPRFICTGMNFQGGVDVEIRAKISVGPDELQTLKVRLENIFSETDNKEQLIFQLSLKCLKEFRGNTG